MKSKYHKRNSKEERIGCLSHQCHVSVEMEMKASAVRTEEEDNG
uniref:Uncharacterized protein n=1 Tax=Arundo donax TaxID=35708 RepID=A0A0A8YBV6_ARUDO